MTLRVTIRSDNINTDYLTVEQISELLNIHQKTVQRYIREGKLNAIKVGKSWRVSKNEMNVFLEKAKVQDNSLKTERIITTSSVVDIPVNDTEDAIRIMNLLVSALNSKPSEFSKASMKSQYNEQDNTVRVMLWSDIYLMSAIVNMIIAITK